MIPPRIENVEVLDSFCLKITYTTGEKKIYDMKKLLKYDFYAKLKDLQYFKSVKSVGTTIEWKNGEDIDPNELYNNSKNIDE